MMSTAAVTDSAMAALLQSRLWTIMPPAEVPVMKTCARQGSEGKRQVGEAGIAWWVVCEARAPFTPAPCSRGCIPGGYACGPRPAVPRRALLALAPSTS
jgi:hypothetical protein